MASNGSQENGEDDDFGDFGGFEAADLSVDDPAEQGQGQATSSPWAILSTGNAAGTPDLLCAQNRFPPYLDPSGIAPAAPPTNNSNVSGSDPAELEADLLRAHVRETPRDPTQRAENVLDGAFNGDVRPASTTNGQLPDIGLGSHANRLFSADLAPPDGAFRAQLPEPSAALSQDAQPSPTVDALPNQAVPLVNAAGDIVLASPSLPNELPEAAPPVDVVENGNQAFQDQLNSLLERNQILEEELRQCQEDLDTQRARLSELQVQHTEDLEKLRLAGHDSLSIVVDQYKEQAKADRLEQQDVCNRRLVETIGQQMETFQSVLQTQEDNFSQQMESHSSRMTRTIESVVEEAGRLQQERFDAFLVEEQDRQKKAIESAIKEEREASQRTIAEAVKSESDLAHTRLDEARLEFSQLLEEERRNQEAALRLAKQEEEERMKTRLDDLVREERERGREAVRLAVENARELSRHYLEEQRRADRRVRQRHLVSLDLFLESARQQISLLLEPADKAADQDRAERGDS